MKSILDFLLKINELKGKRRRGWGFHKIKNAETTAEHIFHLAIMVWMLGKDKDINMEKAIKMALIHDICEVYAPDFTSYDAKAIPEKGRITEKQLLKIKPKKGRPTHIQRIKMEKIKQKLEEKAMKKILSKLEPDIKSEIKNLWDEYQRGTTKEARFVRQIDKINNFLQGIIYWSKYGKIEYNLWLIRIKEVIDDPVILDFLEEIEKLIIYPKLKELDKNKKINKNLNKIY